MTRVVALLVALCTSAALAAPASAATAVLEDRTGDASGPLDITAVKIDNGQERLVVTVTLDRVEPGDVAVAVEVRGGKGVTLGSAFHGGKTRSFATDQAFSYGGAVGHRFDCAGLTSAWNQQHGTVRLSMPARCLANAEYGDVRVVVLAEGRGGADSDYAPQQPQDHFRRSPWIARG